MRAHSLAGTADLSLSFTTPRSSIPGISDGEGGRLPRTVLGCGGDAISDIVGDWVSVKIEMERGLASAFEIQGDRYHCTS
jgi:hypothetical protein